MSSKDSVNQSKSNQKIKSKYQLLQQIVTESRQPFPKNNPYTSKYFYKKNKTSNNNINSNVNIINNQIKSMNSIEKNQQRSSYKNILVNNITNMNNSSHTISQKSIDYQFPNTNLSRQQIQISNNSHQSIKNPSSSHNINNSTYIIGYGGIHNRGTTSQPYSQISMIQPYHQNTNENSQNHILPISSNTSIKNLSQQNKKNQYHSKQQCQQSFKLFQAKVESLQYQLRQVNDYLTKQGNNGQIAQKMSKEIGSLKSILKDQQNRCNELQIQLNKQRNLNSMLRQQLQSSQAINQQLRDNLTHMNDQLVSFGKHVQNSHKEMTSNRSDTHKMHEQIMGLTGKLQNLNMQYELVQRQKQSYKRQYEQQNRKVNALRNQIKHLENEKINIQSQIEKYDEVNKKDRQHIEQIFNERQNEFNKITEELNWYKEKFNNINNNNGNNCSKNNSKQDVYSFSSQKNVKNNGEIHSNESIKSINQRNSQQQHSNHQHNDSNYFQSQFNLKNQTPKHINKSQKQIFSQASQYQNKRMKRQIQQLSQRQSQTKQKYKSIIKQLQQKINEQMNQNHQIKSQSRRLQNLIKQKQFQINQQKTKELHRQSLWNDKQKYYQKQLQKCNKEISNMTSQLNDTTCQINQLKDQINIAGNGISQQNYSLNQKISYLQGQLNRKIMQLRELSQQKLYLQQDLQRQKIRFKKLRQEIQNGKQIQSQIQKLLQELKQIKKSNGQFQQQNKRYSEELNKYRRQIIPKYQRQVQLLKTNISEYQQKIQDTQRNQNDYQKNYQQVEEKYLQLEQQINKKNQQSIVLCNKMNQIQKLYEQSAHKQKFHLEQIKFLKQNNQKTTHSFQNYKKIVADLQQKENIWSFENKSLQSHVKSLEQKMNAYLSQRLQMIKYNDQLKQEIKRANSQQMHINNQHKKFIEKYEKLIVSEQEKQKLQSSAIQYYQNQLKKKGLDITNLKNEVIAAKRQILEKQHGFNRQKMQFQEQIQKLKVQNHYHRMNIDKFFREGVLISANGTSMVIDQIYQNNSHVKTNLNEFSDMIQKQKGRISASTNKNNKNYHHQNNRKIIPQQDSQQISSSDFTNNQNYQNQKNSPIVMIKKDRFKYAETYHINTQESSQYGHQNNLNNRYFTTQSSKHSPIKGNSNHQNGKNINKNLVIQNNSSNFKNNQNLSFIEQNFNNQQINNNQNCNSIQENLLNLQQDNIILQKRLQRANKDVTKLKNCIDSHLIQNGITPREANTCAIARAIWLVQIMSTNMKQYKTDIQTLKIQKRQILTKCEKLEMKNESLIHDKERVLTQMQIMLEKMKQLQNYQKQNDQGTMRMSSYMNNMASFSFKDPSAFGVYTNSLKNSLNSNSNNKLKIKQILRNRSLKSRNQNQQNIKSPVHFTFGNDYFQERDKKRWTNKIQEIQQDQSIVNSSQGNLGLNSKLYKNKSSSYLLANNLKNTNGIKKYKNDFSEFIQPLELEQNGIGMIANTNNKINSVSSSQNSSKYYHNLKKMGSNNIKIMKIQQQRKKLMEQNMQDLQKLNQQEEDDVFSPSYNNHKVISIKNFNKNLNKTGHYVTPQSAQQDQHSNQNTSNKDQRSNSTPQDSQNFNYNNNKKRTKKFDKNKYINNSLRNPFFDDQNTDQERYFKRQ